MTVSELIQKLKALPQDAEVLYPNGEYKDANSTVNKVEYHKNTWYEKHKVILSVS